MAAIDDFPKIKWDTTETDRKIVYQIVECFSFPGKNLTVDRLTELLTQFRRSIVAEVLAEIKDK